MFKFVLGILLCIVFDQLTDFKAFQKRKGVHVFFSIKNRNDQKQML